MKLPNGYGSVSKLSGNRRNPYRAVITTNWTYDEDTKKSKQVRKTIGYYPTKKEALEALALYNSSPYDTTASKITFKQVYERWADEHFPTVKEHTANSYETAFILCKDIESKRMVDIKFDDLQNIIDTSGKHTPTLKCLKSMLSGMFKYAEKHDIISHDRNKVSLLDVSKAGNPNKIPRERFTQDEIQSIWNKENDDIYYSVILMLIYSGVRINEMLNLRKADVNLNEHYFSINESKTKAGIRKVPIADKTYKFFEYWYTHNENCDYLICGIDGHNMDDSDFRRNYWNPLLAYLKTKHRPHDCRHTCISLLTEAGIDERRIKQIVGHKGDGVTQKVYTHLDILNLLDAINQI